MARSRRGRSEHTQMGRICIKEHARAHARERKEVGLQEKEARKTTITTKEERGRRRRQRKKEDNEEDEHGGERRPHQHF